MAITMRIIIACLTFLTFCFLLLLPTIRSPLSVTSVSIPPSRYVRWNTFGAAQKRIAVEMRRYISVLNRANDNPAVQTHAAMTPVQHTLYFEDASRAGVICETGFKDGISTALWMASSNESTLHTFDLAFPNPASDSMTYLEERYPGRIIKHVGDSKDTIPTLPDGTCDLVSIDGDHSFDGVLGDIVRFRSKVTCDHVVYMDDVFDCPDDMPLCAQCDVDCNCAMQAPCNVPSRSLQRAIREGIVDLIACFAIPPQWSEYGTFAKGFCIMKYRDVC